MTIKEKFDAFMGGYPRMWEAFRFWMDYIALPSPDYLKGNLADYRFLLFDLYL